MITILEWLIYELINNNKETGQFINRRSEAQDKHHLQPSIYYTGTDQEPIIVYQNI